MTLRIAVVVPTCRRLQLLNQCLSALFKQTLDPHQFEIVIADDAEDSGTQKLVETRSGDFAGTILYLPVTTTHGPAAARNVGWRAANADVIAFTDDDCQPASDWLAEGLRAMESGAQAAWGKLIMPLPSTPSDYEANAAELSRSVFVTANCFIRRDVLQAVGGFDERFPDAWREDSDLYFSLLEKGYAVISAPAAIVVHPIRQAPWGISLRQQRKAQVDVLLYKKHPQSYREHLPRFPRLYLVWAAGASLAMLGVALQRLDACGVGISVLLLASGIFCYLRLAHTSRRPLHIAEMIVTSLLIPPISLYWRIRGVLRYRAFPP